MKDATSCIGTRKPPKKKISIQSGLVMQKGKRSREMILFIIIIVMTVVFKGLYTGGLYESGECMRDFFITIAKYIIEMVIKKIVKKCAG